MSDTEIKPSVDLFADFATDDDAVENGAWVAYRGGAEFLIARLNNKAHSAAIVDATLSRPDLMLSEGELAQLPKDQSEKIAAETRAVLIKAEAKTLLLGWRGPLRHRNKDLGTYTPEKAEMLLQMGDFRTWVRMKAAEASRFRAKLEEADEKN